MDQRLNGEGADSATAVRGFCELWQVRQGLVALFTAFFCVSAQSQQDNANFAPQAAQMREQLSARELRNEEQRTHRIQELDREAAACQGKLMLSDCLKANKALRGEAERTWKLEQARIDEARRRLDARERELQKRADAVAAPTPDQRREREAQAQGARQDRQQRADLAQQDRQSKALQTPLQQQQRAEREQSHRNKQQGRQQRQADDARYEQQRQARLQQAQEHREQVKRDAQRRAQRRADELKRKEERMAR